MAIINQQLAMMATMMMVMVTMFNGKNAATIAMTMLPASNKHSGTSNTLVKGEAKAARVVATE